MTESALKTTPLTAAHRAAGARMVEFGGYAMPLQFSDGILKEHLWTRAHAGLFDVSHMGPALLSLAAPSGEAEADHRAVAALIEPLVSGDIAGLKPGQLRYTLLLNEAGGIVDDLIVGRPVGPERAGSLYLVVNAGTKEGDFARIAAAAGGWARLERLDGDHALIALQGPEAAAALGALVPGVTDLTFMTWAPAAFEGHALAVARSGYTGEDGFEILVPAAGARALADRLLADDRVRPIGLGARDSLRLEAGLPLYGHDMDETVSPIEAGLAFAVARRRRKAADFPGAARILKEIAEGPARVRVGLAILEGAPAREGAAIAEPGGGPEVGRITSGGFSPSLSAPIALGFAPPRLAAEGTALEVVVRGRRQPAEVRALPFTPHRYHR